MNEMKTFFGGGSGIVFNEVFQLEQIVSFAIPFSWIKKKYMCVLHKFGVCQKSVKNGNNISHQGTCSVMCK